MREFIQNLSEISEQICKFAAVLKNKNIKRTQIFLSDMSEFKIAFFGAMLAGTKPELLRDNHFEDGFFGIDDEKFADICAEFENLGEFGELNLNGSEIFYLKTSGSTGKPKNIQKSLLDMVLEAKHLAKALNLSSQEQFLASVTHQNMFGLTFKFFLPLVLGAKSDGGEYNYPEIIFDQSLNGSILISSPTILNALYQHKNAKKIENLKMIISAGARLPQNLRDELNKITNASIVDIYGSSETGVVGANLGAGLKKFEPVNLEVGSKGELIITSPWCKRFESSDSGEIRGDDIILHGRLDRIVKFSENRVNLDAIEEKLNQNELIKDCKLGLHPKFERILALIVLSESGEEEFRKNGKKSIVENLKKYLKYDFGSVVRYFKIVSKVPYSAQSKVKKDDFLKAYESYEMPEFTQISQNEFKAKIKPSDFYFDGHFASFPVVPGFMQFKFAKICAEKLGYDLQNLSHIPSIKFMHFIRPNDEITITFEKKEKTLSFKIKSQKECCNGKISL